jgi:hypothetical protein
MRKLKFVPLMLLALAGTLALQSCMAGGWHLTRKLAAWNNAFSIVPRILIYVAFFVLQVYTITSIVDAFWFNIGDFWNGRVTASNQKYHKKGMEVTVVNVRDPLRHTTITSRKGERVVSTVELKEVDSGKVAMYVNGMLRGEVSSIRDVDLNLVLYKEDGKTVSYTKIITGADLRVAQSLPEGQPADYLKTLGVVVPTAPVYAAK